MTESFAHAYVSAMVRAGEAIGHGKLFEVVQNEELGISAMLPYDIFSDETQEWEDPCKPFKGMTLGLNADDLTRRAHARAMIEKSLKKLQDKNNIKGGTLSAGPYADPAAINQRFSSGGLGGGVGVGGKYPPGLSPRVGMKRKYSSTLEPPVPPGTGSAKATTWNVFHPRHVTEALVWNPTLLEVLPYGKHCTADRYVSQSLIGRSSNDAKRRKKLKLPDIKTPTTTGSMAITATPSSTGAVQAPLASEQPEEWQQADTTGGGGDGCGGGMGGFPRSTLEIPWSDVADIFQRVELPKKSSTSRSSSLSATTATAGGGHHISNQHHQHESTPLPIDGKIFAPFCRKLVTSSGSGGNSSSTILWEEGDEEDESETEEDIREESILSRHEAVLGRMKLKLSQYMEEKRQQQDRRKNRSSTVSKARS